MLCPCADLRWGFVRQGDAAPLDDDSFQRVQRAVKAYAAARDAEPGDEFYDPDTIGKKLAKAAKQASACWTCESLPLHPYATGRKLASAAKPASNAAHMFAMQ